MFIFSNISIIVGTLLLGFLMVDFLCKKKKCSVLLKRKERLDSSYSPMDRIEIEETKETSFFIPPIAPVDSSPYCCVLDFQTTGLSTTPNYEDKILEIGAMILDKELRVIRSLYLLVKQDTVGTFEARKVHRISPQKLAMFGIPLLEALRKLQLCISDVGLIVCHNSVFDITIWIRAIQSSMSLAEEQWLLEKRTFCTMDFATKDPIWKGQFPSLRHLFEVQYGRSSGECPHTGIAQRNVMLTRLCYQYFLETYSSEEIQRNSYFVSEILSLEKN